MRLSGDKAIAIDVPSCTVTSIVRGAGRAGWAATTGNRAGIRNNAAPAAAARQITGFQYGRCIMTAGL